MNLRTTRRVRAAALVAAGMMALAACGDDDAGASLEPDDGAVDGQLTVLAEDIRFDRESYAAAAGPVEITYGNEGNILHSLVIEGVDGFRLVVTSNGNVTDGTIELDSGDYVLFCDVAGHRRAGMEATLTVE